MNTVKNPLQAPVTSPGGKADGGLLALWQRHWRQNIIYIGFVVIFVLFAVTLNEKGFLDPINLLGVLRRARGSFVIVTNEFGVVQGLVTPLDVLEAIAGEFPDEDETPEIVADGEGWLVKGTTDLHALSHTLGLENVVNDEEDIATVAGLVIAVNGQIPRVGDVIELPPLHITIVEANDYRVDMVRIVKEQSAHDEDE